MNLVIYQSLLNEEKKPIFGRTLIRQGNMFDTCFA